MKNQNTMPALQSFRLFLVRKGLKPSTIKGDVEIVARFLKTDQNADSYIMALIDQGKKNTYINSIIKALRNYGSFSNSKDLSSIPFFKVDKNSDKGIMEHKEIQRFLNLPPLEYVKGMYLWHYYKMSLFWKCLAYSGARTGEIAGLKINDVDLGRQVFLVDGKTGKRNVPINPILTDNLTEHIASLKGAYLFPSMRTDRPIERSSWNFDFDNRIRRLGIKRENLSPYSLRHSFITRMLEEDVNLFKVQKIVGHRQIATTAHYTHLTTKDIVVILQKDPLGREKMGFNDRYKLFRESVRRLLEAYCLTPVEEKQMLLELVS